MMRKQQELECDEVLLQHFSSSMPADGHLLISLLCSLSFDVEYISFSSKKILAHDLTRKCTLLHHVKKIQDLTF